MIRKIVSIALIGAVLVGNTACNSNGSFKKFKGIEYNIVKDASGENIKLGDIVEFHIIAKADTMTLADSRTQQNGKPAVMKVEEPKGSGQFQSVFTKLSVGDSCLVEISCDTMIKAIPPQQAGQLPPWLKKGKKIKVSITIVSVKSEADYKKEMDAKQAEAKLEAEKKAAAQMPIDDKLIQDYLAKNNIKATKTASGLYYTIKTPGTGAAIAQGQMVSMKYTGKTLDGKAFDSNVDTAIGHHGTEALKFPVGAHQMIPGVDEGVALLKKGAKATLFLPSPLAYGEQAPPNIGPNAVLVFDVEITEVKDAPKQEPGQMPAQ